MSSKSFWWKKSTRTITFTWFRQIRKRNKAEYGKDPDINTKMQWGIRTNGARRGNLHDSCLDLTIMIGHLEINYVNWEFNRKRRIMAKQT